MDRSTKATLSTYNTWIQLSRLQKIYHFQSPKLRLAAELLAAARLECNWASLFLVMWQWKWWTTLLSQHGFRLRGVQS